MRGWAAPLPLEVILLPGAGGRQGLAGLVEEMDVAIVGGEADDGAGGDAGNATLGHRHVGLRLQAGMDDGFGAEDFGRLDGCRQRAGGGS